MDLKRRLQLERDYHESQDQARGDTLLREVYSSGLFDEAERYHLDVLGDVRGAYVLDYGCGGGWSAARLRARGARVTGFDISQTRLAEARAHLFGSSSGPRVDLLQCAAEELPFANATFDAVLGKGILHHLELNTAILEIVRVLCPGGRAVFFEPLIHNPLLEGYRRLTPHLRSPTERALSTRDLRRVASPFGRWTHKEFCLLAVLPALVEALTSKSPALMHVRLWLQRVDRKLVDVVPFIGRYCWVTVITLECWFPYAPGLRLAFPHLRHAPVHGRPGQSDGPAGV